MACARSEPAQRVRRGGSEADFALDAAGDSFVLIRNEAGDQGGFGPKVCSAPADRLSDWNCIDDGRKFDSPRMFQLDGSPIDGADLPWSVGQRRATYIYRHDLQFTRR